jgi:DNA integrity scanning protein DisA with diadenylate cyclase activity
LANSKPKTLALLNESLQISIVKKSTFDVCSKFLSTQRLEVRDNLLIEMINKVPLSTFKHVLASKNSEMMYKQRLQRVVETIVVSYISYFEQKKKEKGQ